MDVIYRQEYDRWVKGDRHVRPILRKLLRRKNTQLSGMQTVVRNFLIGLDKRKIDYSYNRPFFSIGRSRKIISFGLGMNGVKGLARSNPVIAAIGFPYPAELPDLCNQYDIRKYLQHSRWILDLTRSANIYRDEIFDLWPAGIDTDEWKANETATPKAVDALIYSKIHWDKASFDRSLVQPIRDFLGQKKVSFSEVRYGSYTREEYRERLGQTKVMIFVSAHETQGLAYQECMSCNVPVIAWDQGYWLDPIRYKYDRPVVQATSVPFFDKRCGTTFRDFKEFMSKFEGFFDDAQSGEFAPREFILENLSIEKSTERMLEIYKSI